MAAKRTITTAEFIEMTGVSRPRLSDLVARRIIPKAERGRFPHPEAIRAYCEFMGKQASGRAESDLAKARTALAIAQRDAVEIKNSVARGEYVMVSDIAREWGNGASILRSHVMSIPTRAAAVIPTLTRHDCETLDDVVREVLHQAADFLDRDLNPPPPINP